MVRSCQNSSSIRFLHRSSQIWIKPPYTPYTTCHSVLQFGPFGPMLRLLIVFRIPIYLIMVKRSQPSCCWCAPLFLLVSSLSWFQKFHFPLSTSIGSSRCKLRRKGRWNHRCVAQAASQGSNNSGGADSENCWKNVAWSTTAGSMVNMPNTLARSCSTFTCPTLGSWVLSHNNMDGCFEHEWVIWKVSAQYKACGFFYAKSVEIVK